MKDKHRSEKKPLLPPFDLTRQDGILFVIGIVILLAGYVLMSFGPWDNPLSRTVSPLVLLAGYLIIFPLAILGRKNILRRGSAKSEDQRESEEI